MSMPTRVAVTVAASQAELRQQLDPASGRVALVPTMGALHDGHAALIRRARAETDGPVVVWVFVNPLQFGEGEDLDRYPRDLEADLEVCAANGATHVYTPVVEEVYPDGDPQVSVDPGPLGAVLEGAARPTHFRGVLTVVAKMLGLVRPDLVVFGEKDYQQLVLVRRMVADLCLDVSVLGEPTVREPDGLALSSRNRYLDAVRREQATVLSRALFAAGAVAAGGGDAALGAARAELAGVPEAAVDYLALSDPDLGPAPSAGNARLLVAARLDGTRLIDNVALSLGGDS